MTNAEDRPHRQREYNLKKLILSADRYKSIFKICIPKKMIPIATVHSRQQKVSQVNRYATFN